MEVSDDIPQSEKIDEDQVPNSAGGFGWKIDDMQRLRRFMCLGSEGGTFYAGEKELGLENAQCIQRLIDDGKGTDVIDEIVKFSVEGRTAKQNPIIFALALCARQDKDLKAKKYCYDNMRKVLRIPTHLFQFIECCEKLSKGTGWGRAHRRAVSNWYLDFKNNPKKLAEHVTKYKNRNGWCHKDLLRLSHPKPDTPEMAAIIKYVVKGLDESKQHFDKEDADNSIRKIFDYLEAVEKIKTVKEATEIVDLVRSQRLVREHIPTDFLNNIEVWRVLNENMPMTAMIRNLGKMSTIGLLKDGSADVVKVCEKLQDTEALKAAKIHPFNVLVALNTYQKGHGDKGKLSWEVSQPVVRALNEAYYKSFKNVEPTNQRYLLALDVSGSMTWGGVNGCTAVTPREASAALSMVTMRTERVCDLVAFSTDLKEMKDITADMDLPQVIKKIERYPMGGTDCAQPMLWAKKHDKKYDVFIIYTDCETWAGAVHPAEALRQYRSASGIWNAKLIVCGMTSSEITLADPEDPGMLDMVGFDSNGPEIMRNFVMGNL